jgi:hypothetical protein
MARSEAGTLSSVPDAPQIDIDPSPASGGADTPAAAQTDEARAQQVRDERGRFAAAQAEREATAAGQKPMQQPASPVVDPAEQSPATRKPPSSWRKDQWDAWGKLDPQVQAYIEQREGEAAKGVSTYKQQFEQAQPILQAIQPFIPELQQHGIQPETWIQNLGNAHRTLALGSPEQKLQMFAKLATDYGVPLQALTGGQADPQMAQLLPTVNSLQTRIAQFEAQTAQAQQAQIMGQIEAFKAKAPFFDEVHPTMAGLLQSGVATDLQSAYDKAIRLDDNVWSRHQAEQAREANAKRQAELTLKRAAAASPKSSSPTGAVATGGGKKSLRDTLSAAFDSVDSGRF